MRKRTKKRKRGRPLSTDRTRWRTQRLELGATQQEFADIIGKSQQWVSFVERGLEQIDFESLNKLCRWYRITPYDLGYSIRTSSKPKAVRFSDFRED